MSAAPRRSPVSILFLTVFIDLVGFSIIFPLFPSMLDYYFEKEGTEGLLGKTIAVLAELAGGEGDEAEFRTQVLFGGFLGSLYSVLQFVFAPIWGSLSDRVGRKPVLLLTISGLAVSYVLWFFAGTFALLVAARFIGGIMSGNIAVASAAIADATGTESRAKGMAVIGVAFGLGFILGPAIGGLLSVPALDLAEPTGGFAGINRFSAPAAAAFLLSVGNLLWVKARFVETLGPEERGRARAARPINPVRLFHRFEYPGVNRAHFVYFVFLLAFAGMEFTLTFLARDCFAYESWDIAWIFVYVGLIIVVVQGGVVRRLAPRVGEKKLVVAGLALIPAGLLLTGVSGRIGSPALLYAALAALATGSALVTPCMAALVSIYSPRERQGEIQGVFRSLGALSRAVGPVVAGAIYFEYDFLALYTGGALLVGLPLVLSLGQPPPVARRDRENGRETGEAAPEETAPGTRAGGKPEVS